MFTHRVTANISGRHTAFDLKSQTLSTVTMTEPCCGCAVQSMKLKDCTDVPFNFEYLSKYNAIDYYGIYK